MKRIATMIYISAACLAACGSMQNEEGTTEKSEAFTRTAVYFNADGTETVIVSEVTLAQQIAEHEAEMNVPASEGPVQQTQQAITYDGSCASTSVRIWDQTGYTGHQICFYGNGTADLATYCRTYLCLGHWDNNVRSFKSGNWGGFFGKNGGYCSSGGSGAGPCPNANCDWFNGSTNRTPATTCEQTSRWLRIGTCETCPG